MEIARTKPMIKGGRAQPACFIAHPSAQEITNEMTSNQLRSTWYAASTISTIISGTYLAGWMSVTRAIHWELKRQTRHPMTLAITNVHTMDRVRSRFLPTMYGPV